jgi:hypothetical protein
MYLLVRSARDDMIAWAKASLRRGGPLRRL